MYNEQLLNKLVEKFGQEATILFCKMESEKNDILYKDCIIYGDDEPVEYDFERDWWAESSKTLKQRVCKD